MSSPSTFVYLGEALAKYHFGASHPFGPTRHDAFADTFYQRGLEQCVDVLTPVDAPDVPLSCFHTPEYIAMVQQASEHGEGLLDADTPAFSGVFEVARTVVATTLDGIARIMQGQYRRGFTPIGGLHHARADGAAGFCVFNDCAVAIAQLLSVYGLSRVLYVDIDAHHGDGVFYGFESEPRLYFVDLHEDGRYLYPGTGAADEVGQAAAKGTKLNIPMPMYADDTAFYEAWAQAEQFIETAEPEFILLQCGADSLKGDPITHMHYSAVAHQHAAARLCQLADKYSQGRIMAMGGGGYAMENIAAAWNAVVDAFCQHDKL